MDDTLKKIEEIKELGEEYRYRDQLMVQEFYLAMVVISFGAGLLNETPFGPKFLVVHAISVLFLFLLYFHLKHLNFDRKETGGMKYKLITEVGWKINHKGFDKKHWRVSVPNLMVMFTGLIFAAASLLFIANVFVFVNVAPRYW